MKKYYMDSNVRVLFNGANEIRIRAGLFNYNEATLDLTPFDEPMKEATKEMIQRLKKGFSYEEVDELTISDENKETLKGLMGELLEANIIFDKHGDYRRTVSDIILGKISEAIVPEDMRESKVLFITDCDYSMKLAKDLCNEIHMDLGFAGFEVLSQITELDTTTNIDALKTEKAMHKMEELLGGYDAYVVVLKHLSMKFLRNINRYVLGKQKTMTVGLIDGPFVTVFSIAPPSTGCAECFENRILARLEDHQLYQQYVNNDDYSIRENNPAILLLASMLTNIAISEAFLLRHYSMTKFEGRVLSIFIPTFEIQTQDLLRIPHCPACGYVSKAQFDEINLESRVLVDELTKEMH